MVEGSLVHWLMVSIQDRAAPPKSPVKSSIDLSTTESRPKSRMCWADWLNNVMAFWLSVTNTPSATASRIAIDRLASTCWVRNILPRLSACSRIRLNSSLLLMAIAIWFEAACTSSWWSGEKLFDWGWNSSIAPRASAPTINGVAMALRCFVSPSGDCIQRGSDNKSSTKAPSRRLMTHPARPLSSGIAEGRPPVGGGFVYPRAAR